MARQFAWQRKPIDSKVIEEISDRLFRIVVSTDLVIGKELGTDYILGVASYLADNHIDGPWFGLTDKAVENFEAKFNLLLSFQYRSVENEESHRFVLSELAKSFYKYLPEEMQKNA